MIVFYSYLENMKASFSITKFDSSLLHLDCLPRPF